MSLEKFYWDSITFWPKIKIPCVIKRLKYCLGIIQCNYIGVMWFVLRIALPHIWATLCFMLWHRICVSG